METIRYLLGIIIRIALALFLLAFVLWLVSFLYPNLRLSNLVSGDTWKRDWLPAPKNYTSTFASKSGGVYGRTYEPGPAYNGYQNTTFSKGQPGIEYVMYTESGTKIIKPDGSVVPEKSSYSGTTYQNQNRSLYIRNLSVLDGQSITYGQNILGEARDTMFKNGTFTIVITTTDGRVLAAMPAMRIESWAVPGWTRFRATVPTRLPPNTYCVLTFQSANQPLQVALPVQCQN